MTRDPLDGNDIRAGLNHPRQCRVAEIMETEAGNPRPNSLGFAIQRSTLDEKTRCRESRLGLLVLFIWPIPKSSSKSGILSFFNSFAIKLAVFFF
jgi:hypothetical protein